MKKFSSRLSDVPPKGSNHLEKLTFWTVFLFRLMFVGLFANAHTGGYILCMHALSSFKIFFVFFRCCCLLVWSFEILWNTKSMFFSLIHWPPYSFPVIKMITYFFVFRSTAPHFSFFSIEFLFFLQCLCAFCAFFTCHSKWKENFLWNDKRNEKRWSNQP